MSGSTPSTVIHTLCNVTIRITDVETQLAKPGTKIPKKKRNEIDGSAVFSVHGQHSTFGASRKMMI